MSNRLNRTGKNKGTERKYPKKLKSKPNFYKPTQIVGSLFVYIITRRHLLTLSTQMTGMKTTRTHVDAICAQSRI